MGNISNINISGEGAKRGWKGAKSDKKSMCEFQLLLVCTVKSWCSCLQKKSLTFQVTFWKVYRQHGNWCNPIIPKGNLAYCSSKWNKICGQCLYNVILEVPVQLVTSSVLSRVKLDWSIWKQKSYLCHLRVLNLNLWNHSRVSRTALSLSRWFIGSPQQMKLFFISTWWGHCILPAHFLGAKSCCFSPRIFLTLVLAKEKAECSCYRPPGRCRSEMGAHNCHWAQ